MTSFHTASDPAFLSCGEDQTSAWSEAASHEQATLTFDWGVAGPIAVSTDLLRNMRGYSRFIVTQPGWGVRGRI
jgi:hypothetical protein